MPEKLEILVVDDEESIRNLCFRALTKKGYSVETAYSGEEAIEKARSKKYDLIISDIVMEGINGVYAVSEIEKNYAQNFHKPKIIIMTGNAPEQLLEETKKRNYVLLKKPFELNELYEAVEK